MSRPSAYSKHGPLRVLSAWYLPPDMMSVLATQEAGPKGVSGRWTKLLPLSYATFSGMLGTQTGTPDH